jgi:hypothetical protein
MRNHNGASGSHGDQDFLGLLCAFVCSMHQGKIKHQHYITNVSDKAMTWSKRCPYSMVSLCTKTPPKHKGQRRRRYSLGLESGGDLLCVDFPFADEDWDGGGGGQDKEACAVNDVRGDGREDVGSGSRCGDEYWSSGRVGAKGGREGAMEDSTRCKDMDSGGNGGGCNECGDDAISAVHLHYNIHWLLQEIITNLRP